MDSDIFALNLNHVMSLRGGNDIAFFREIQSSNLNRRVDSLHRKYSWFFSTSPCKFLDRPWALPP